MESIIGQLAAWSGNEHRAVWIFVALVGLLAFAVGSAAIAMGSVLLDPVRGRVRALVTAEHQTGHSAWARLRDKIGPWVRPKGGAKAESVRMRLVHAGFRSEAAVTNYYAAQVLLVVGLSMATLVSLESAGATGGTALMGTVCGGLVGNVLPQRWLKWVVARRKQMLYAAMPDALDLLVVCTEAGYGLKPAIQRVAEELQESHPELAAELGLVNAEMRAGVDRVEALRHLAERTNLEDIGGLVSLLSQSLRFGTSVADSLRVYSDDFRDKRTQRAEETAATISTRMVFPLVFCMFPAFFLVAVGPAIIGVMSAFSNQ